MGDLRVSTLGAAQVVRGGQEVYWRAGSARDLFFYLLTHPGGQSREHVVEVLWDIPCDAHASNRFRVTVHRVREALGWPGAVLEEHGRYALAPEVLAASDVHVFWEVVDRAKQAADPGDKLRLYQAALKLYKGTYLPQVGADWAAEPRNALRTAYAQAQLEVARLLDLRGELEGSTQALASALQADPYLGENYHQDLIDKLAQVEGKYAAVEYYRRFAHFLREEVGDTPTPETVELVERIKREPWDSYFVRLPPSLPASG